MPRLSQWYIKVSFIYLILGFTVGGLLLAHKGFPFLPALWAWLPVHIEWLLVGWVAQLTLGVAFWIMPRYWKEPRRGNTTGAYFAIALLNAGILLVTMGTIIPSVSWAVTTGRVLEVAAAVTFAHAIFPRVVGREG